MAMRQSDDPFLALSQLKSGGGQPDLPVSNQEMITVLKSSAQNALMKAAEKKKLLMKALELENQILDLADDGGDSDLKTNMVSELFNTSTAGGATKGWICSNHVDFKPGLESRRAPCLLGEPQLVLGLCDL